MQIENLTEQHMPSALELIRQFNDESSYGLPVDRERAWLYLWSYACPDIAETAGYVAVDDEEVMAGVLLSVSHEVHVKPFCYMTKFFVAPPARRTSAARQLLARVNTFAADHQCSHIFSSATAGLDDLESRLFINLLCRDGYAVGGSILQKDLRHG